ncbi:MAG: Rne/Rng family ribonuclease [Deltaproteobacteria bacterium]|nr:Rne/Rng family ribonuclease [Deltaproteobacteria bacterium]MBW1962693.1 Rne/Rng family ribonuclease [Deltaproteobacteria bacterium]MBW2153030.1 Rne/Rng family ribonuclease [Deltaproteobacteria bacterium]
MYKELIINVTEHETRVALLEDGTIVELFVERPDNADIAGNIYKGRVQRVLPGMQAAFIDIGLQQAAFIYVDDVDGNHHEDLVQRFNDINEEDQALVSGPEDHESVGVSSNQRVPIEDLISEGQEILVQVAKSPIGTKGARVTSYISLPGRFLVLMPNSNHVGISRRIEDETERDRLRNMVLDLKGEDGLGYIVRTASEGIQKEKLAYEMSFLKDLWKNIQKKYKRAPALSLLHQEIAITLRAVRDLLIHEADRLIVDSREQYESILSFLDMFNPKLKDSVELYEGVESIFDAYNLEADISRSLKRKVWLKSGGYIVIEQTEALVAIDVNTGRYVGVHNLEETILKTNLEAVKEIAYQIRLRDIGGIIIIDFIDMEKKANQEKVFNALKEAFKRDRSKTHILPISEMGLIQMTRKRVRRPLNRMLCEPCFYCDGEGYLLSKQSICYNIYREIIRQAQDMMGVRLTLKVNPRIAELLHGEESHLISDAEKTIGKQIVIYPNAQFHLEQFDIFELLKD